MPSESSDSEMFARRAVAETTSDVTPDREDSQRWKRALSEIDQDLETLFNKLVSRRSEDFETAFGELIGFVELLLLNSRQKNEINDSILSRIESLIQEKEDLQRALDARERELRSFRDELRTLDSALSRGSKNTRGSRCFLPAHEDSAPAREDVRQQARQRPTDMPAPAISSEERSGEADRVADDGFVKSLQNQMANQDMELFNARKTIDELLVLLSDLWRHSCLDQRSKTGSYPIVTDEEIGTANGGLDHDLSTKE